MKFYILFILLNILSQKLLSQELRFYFNGSNLEDSAFTNIEDGDLLRVIFLNKKTNYKFRISHVSIILIPTQKSNNNAALISDTTEFIIQNPSEAYTSSPTFTLDLVKELKILRYNNCHVSFKVKHLLSDTEEGSEWIARNMHFKEVNYRRKIATGELMHSNAGNK